MSLVLILPFCLLILPFCLDIQRLARCTLTAKPQLPNTKCQNPKPNLNNHTPIGKPQPHTNWQTPKYTQNSRRFPKLSAAGAPKLDVIRMTRSPGEGGVVFLFGEEGNSFPSSSDRHNPLTFLLLFSFFFTSIFFLGESRHLRAGFPSPLEWNSSPSLVAAVFNALYGGTPPGSGRIGVIGAQPLVAYQDNEK